MAKAASPGPLQSYDLSTTRTLYLPLLLSAQVSPLLIIFSDSPRCLCIFSLTHTKNLPKMEPSGQQFLSCTHSHTSPTVERLPRMPERGRLHAPQDWNKGRVYSLKGHTRGAAFLTLSISKAGFNHRPRGTGLAPITGRGLQEPFCPHRLPGSVRTTELCVRGYRERLRPSTQLLIKTTGHLLPQASLSPRSTVTQRDSWRDTAKNVTHAQGRLGSW